MYYLGIDVGTTGTKTVVCDETGRVISGAYRGYEIRTAPGGISEQSANDWLAAVTDTVREAIAGLDPREVEALSLSTQGATMTAVGEDFSPLCPAITWMDHRADAEAAELTETVGGDEAAYRITGWGIEGSLDAAKILWLKHNRRDIFDGARAFVSTLEFVNYFLTGRNVSDPSNSAIRALYELETGGYNKAVLTHIGLDVSRLPELLPASAFVGQLTPAASVTLGLPETVKVYNGAHDQYCASVGCGAVDPGDMLLSTGTAWVLLGVTDKLMYTKSRIVPGIHPVKGRYGAMASLGGVGNALKWVRDLTGENYGALDAGASGRRVKNAGVYALPYFSGAGFPERESDMRACFCGLGGSSDQYDLAYAVMEGVAFEVRAALEKYAGEGISISRLRMMGGASRSEVWRTLVADICSCTLTCSDNAEACAVGAARLAMLGCGLPLPDTAPGFTVKGSGDSVTAFYDGKYRRYRALSSAMLDNKDLFIK